MEEHWIFVGWWENYQFLGSYFCSPLFQTYSVLYYGWNRCRPGFSQHFRDCLLRQSSYIRLISDGNFIKMVCLQERAVSAQFIIVSLRNQMFETAYRLVGICKPNNRSMTMYIDPMKHVALAEDEKRRTDGRPTGSLFSQETQPPRETGGTTLSQVPRPTVGSSFSQPTQTPRESHRGAWCTWESFVPWN